MKRSLLVSRRFRLVLQDSTALMLISSAAWVTGTKATGSAGLYQAALSRRFFLLLLAACHFLGLWRGLSPLSTCSTSHSYPSTASLIS